MTTILIILGVLVIGAAAVYFLTKTGKIADSDGDNIPDAVEDVIDDIEDKFEDIKEDIEDAVDEVKKRAKDVKRELADVASAIKGKPTKAKLNSLTKQELVDSAKTDFGIDLDISVKKSTLVNKVYSLYNS